MQIKQKLSLIRVKRIYLFLVIILVIWFLKINRLPPDVLPKHISLPNYQVHIFYDGGFRNQKFDKVFRNWPNVSTEEDNLNTAYRPALGLYSSNDPEVIRTHMKQISSAGIGVVVVNWVPLYFDSKPPMTLIMDEAHAHKLKVTIQISVYSMRNIYDIREQIVKFFDKHGKHPALYKTESHKKNKPLPIIYIYKSDLIPFNHWRPLLESRSSFTVRNTTYDALFIGMVETEIDPYIAPELGFDGFYTYVSSKSYTFASTWRNWPHLRDVADERGIIFIPTICPGYDDRSDLKIHTFEDRIDGIYYNATWERALRSKASFIAINSFNGWIHGTQIEPAATLPNEGFDDYEPAGANKYLLLTRTWIIEFANRTYYRYS